MGPRIFSWSKGDRRPETIYRTGGLVPIHSSVGDTEKKPQSAVEVQVQSLQPLQHTSNAPWPVQRRQRPNLTIIPHYNTNPHDARPAPPSALPHSGLSSTSAASNLLAVVNDMLRSPALSAGICPGSAGLHMKDKPLPVRPRSLSSPSSTPNLPELPGSLLLENQGFPSPSVAGPPATPHAMRSARSGNSLHSGLPTPRAGTARANSGAPQHKKSLGDARAAAQRRSKSKPNLIAAASSTDSRLTTCSVSTVGGQTSSNDSNRARVGAESKSLQPAPLIVEKKIRKSNGTDASDLTPISATTPPRKQLDELKATIAAQDSTISTLQAQCRSLRASHEAHVASLAEAHAKEVATLKTYTRVLEEQQSQRTLHHASSNNHLLLLLDTTEPPSPTRPSPPNASIASANSIRSFQTAFEQQTHSPHPFRNNPDMDALRRKLSISGRRDRQQERPQEPSDMPIPPHVARELNALRMNSAAFQEQNVSLLHKLREARQDAKTAKLELAELEKKCAELQEKAEQLEKAEKALQNTVDHLEGRLEIANIDKVDAQEQLLNFQSQHMLDPMPPKLKVNTTRPNPHTSMSTVFSAGAAGSPTSVNETQEPTTLAAFVKRIQLLESQNEAKDREIELLKIRNDSLKEEYDNIANERAALDENIKRLESQSGLQDQLLKETQQSDAHIEQLRSAIINREQIIGEKEKAVRMAERQLEHHKLLLQAEIRRHATMALFANVEEEPLPDLSALASKEDIDRWIERLQKRLKKEQSNDPDQASDDLQAQIAALRSEIDFYVREIIYYKLDIKGYRSDIKQLQRVAATMGDRSGYGSPAPRSTGRSIDTPLDPRLTIGTPSVGFSTTSSPVSTGPISATYSLARPSTPTRSVTTPESSNVGSKATTTTPLRRVRDFPSTPVTPSTPIRRTGFNPANAADNIDPGISPRSVAPISPERRKPTPPSPEQQQRGEMATNFPLSTPASPKLKTVQRSVSDSTARIENSPRTPERRQHPQEKQAVTSRFKMPNTVARARSSSLSEPSPGKATPDRPPRPRYGLFEPKSTPPPPQKDILAEAERNSPQSVRQQNESPEIRQPFARRPAPIAAKPSDTNKPGGLSMAFDPIPRPTSPKRKDSIGSGANIRKDSVGSGRKGSTGSGSDIPFVIAMGSPHNPALLSPTSVPPTPCSITAKSGAGLKLQSNLRSGVGGTMASTTPVTTPVSPTSAMASYFSAKPISRKPVPGSPSKAGRPETPGGCGGTSGGLGNKPGQKGHSRAVSASQIPTSHSSPSHSANVSPKGRSIGRSKTAESASSASSSGHARSISASSTFKNAMQLPSSLMNIKGKGRMKRDKDSMNISNPTPLASPFDIDGEKAANSRTFGNGKVGEIGKAL